MGSQETKKEKLQRFAEAFKERMGDAEIGISSSAIAYYLLLSIFPLMIALGNLLPLLKIDPETMLGYLQIAIPPTVFELLEGTIRNLLENSSGGLLSISAVTTLWAASKSINALSLALNKAYGLAKTRNMVISRILSFFIIFGLMMMVVAVTVVFTLGQTIIDYLTPYFPVIASFSDKFGTLKWPGILITLFITMLLIYTLLPNAKLKWRSIIPGTLFATVSWMLLTQLFGYYAKYFASSFSSYGIIGSFIIVMLWFNFAASVIIIGGILNASTEEYTSGEIKVRDSVFHDVKKKMQKNED
ncbi:YihY/virulence factor BrkB family protein [Vagococcus lutrae]|uniref:YihY/virulence factor BrkB family protein n=1 Tax=Vagococcus lutrae TaxID=81947 RepID=A0AAE9XL71_9ENTE|nr:YihY/virulence factor BrkB family protein [Vagococcus lutrae]MCO7150855.1 YihY/virulence factor BrkB family protein [Vagococcus lutrae]MDT2811570.1 YihY/virulence factor BrkB family protein [Vagococcus lutrae]MDT2819687.1 YihY/virulence factor BrkB family protein [Vagococcus lutrae]MDT2844499.1 YihY/virulence factor BrkB family protein [Vagococcus lutrae]RST93860.1 ribonuclease BN [Vagococcus lutrae]